jgi:hypothetical protein
MTTNSQDDEVLARLYKEGAKDTPSAKLDNEIINYAANAKKSTSNHNHVSSHFDGGWKVPLSLAASVVVVFALLIQLDQSSQQLELPSIPELSIPTESNQYEFKDEGEETNADDFSSLKRDTKKSDLDSQTRGEAAPGANIDKPVRKESQSATTLNKPGADEKTEQVRQNSRERTVQEKYQPSDDIRIQNQSNSNATPVPTTTISKSKSSEGYAPKLSKPQAAQSQIQEPTNEDLISTDSETRSDGMMRQKSIEEKSIESSEDDRSPPDLAADTKMDSNTEQEFAPIPVGDWLLMIEKLIARKDYAEAARQLQKFKQAHPKVNVEDLESSIP